MMWMYAVRGKELYAIDATSLSQLNDFSDKVDWVWVDVFNPDEKESEIVSELLGNEPKIVNDIRKGTYNPPKVYARHESHHDYVLLSIPSILLESRLQIYPIFMIIKKKMFITWGEEQAHRHSRIIKSTIRRLREHVEEGKKPNSPLAIAMLFREVTSRNSEAMFGIREEIDLIEEKSLTRAGQKHDVMSVFSLKRKISALHRLFTDERNFMLDISETMVPHIRLDKNAKQMVDASINAVNHELSWMDSYNRSLDSLLTLQDLSSIHRVESSINYLTIILVGGTIALIILELLGKLGIP